MDDRFEVTDGCLLGITTDNAASNSSMPCQLQSTFEASGMEWPAFMNHIALMANVIHLALGAIVSRLVVNGCTKSSEDHECDQ